LELLKEFAKFSLFRIAGLRPLLKDPLAVFSAEWLASTFNLSVVVMVRHPAAFVSSIKRLGWEYPFAHFLEQPLLVQDHLHPFLAEIEEYATKKHDIVDQAALLWNLIHHMIGKYQDQHNDWIFVRHEDISRQPLTGFSFLFDKLDLKFSPRIQERIKEYSDAINPINSENPFLIRRNSQAIVNKWQQELSKSQIARIRNKVENISDRFYENEDW
jgi:hypothetical protein